MTVALTGTGCHEQSPCVTDLLCRLAGTRLNSALIAAPSTRVPDVGMRIVRGSTIGSAPSSRLLGGARLCSLLLDSDLGRWDKAQVGGVVVTTLTSEKSLVRTQVRPLPGQSVAGEQRRGLAAGEQ
jgi:hypothetical protein